MLQLWKLTSKAFVATALIAFAAMAGTMLNTTAAIADSDTHKLEDHQKEYVYGKPANPSEAWVIASGMRLYDNWMNVLDHKGPGTTHPSWPASNTKKKGNTTWRCKSCHGWDFKGKDGKYASGSYKTGITGVMSAATMHPDDIHQIILDDTHKYTYDMIPAEVMTRLSKALAIGLYDTDDYIGENGSVKGDLRRGREIFQNVCASCHGYDGTALDWGEENDPAYVSTEANANPWEVIAKIRHGHPGVEMVSLIAFPMSDIASILKYVRTLPQK
jgi:thiosulfate dehydrogenase